jgi:pimeloyl-ACP methyl ester carboxylesterase
MEGGTVRKMLYGLVILGVLIALAFAFGPRVAVDTKIAFDPNSIGTDPDAYLAKSEAAVAGIRDGMQKEIVWAFPASKAKTPIALVYIHGFSATKGEVRPVPDLVAKALGANLFLTRLHGHGQDGAAMASASVNDWVNDMAEALAIGHRLGEKVIVMGTSMGGGLATWAASDPTLSSQIDAMVLISPNYGVQASGSFLLTLPFGEQLANLIVGKERSFVPVNALHAKFWTPVYPTKSVLPMAALTKLAAAAPVEQIKQPALFIYSETDKVVQPALTKAIAARWGGPHEIQALAKNDDPYSHVIAGDALSPSTSAEVSDLIVTWVKGVTH